MIPALPASDNGGQYECSVTLNTTITLSTTINISIISESVYNNINCFVTFSNCLLIQEYNY